MLSNFSPGLTFIFRHLPTLCLPIGATYILYKLVQTQLGIDLPIRALVVLLVLSFPAYLFFSALYAEWVDRRDAAAHGAVLPPQVYDKWPGGFGLLLKSVRNHKEGYPGKFSSVL
jgi:hypothetical protein